MYPARGVLRLKNGHRKNAALLISFAIENASDDLNP
jgi:hypothetical protein